VESLVIVGKVAGNLVVAHGGHVRDLGCKRLYFSHKFVAIFALICIQIICEISIVYEKIVLSRIGLDDERVFGSSIDQTEIPQKDNV